MLTLVLPKVMEYSKAVMPSKNDALFRFHNWTHVKEVVESAELISMNEGCSQHEIDLLKIAAYLHDIGFKFDYANHEKVGAQMAEDLLATLEVDDADIGRIKQLILSTKIGIKPQSKLEQILCDADLAHLSSKEFFTKTEALKQETAALKKEEIDENSWKKTNENFLTNIKYYTPFAIDTMQPGLDRNLKTYAEGATLPVAEIKEKVKNSKEKNKKKYGRGVETLFRTTSHNHLILSQIADSKANLMITINAGLLSYMLTKLLYAKEIEFMTIPIYILIVCSLFSIVTAILATRPHNTKGTFELDEVLNSRTNILFFGNFHKMEITDFERGIDRLIEREDLLYSSLTKDIFFLGVVLGRKYHLVRLSYTSFTIGFIIFIITAGLILLNSNMVYPYNLQNLKLH